MEILRRFRARKADGMRGVMEVMRMRECESDGNDEMTNFAVIQSGAKDLVC